MTRKALVVDNDFFFLEFLSELLENHGYEVIRAFDGKEGITRLEEGQIDLLFVDLIMPKIDGLRLIHLCREKYPWAPFPIIAVSAALLEYMDSKGDMGADYYVAKGPLKQMSGQFECLLERLEKTPLASLKDNVLFPPIYYPRQIVGELLDAIQFQRAVAESLGLGIMVLDEDTKILDANAYTLEMADRSLVEILNRPVSALFPPQERALLVLALEAVAKDLSLKKFTIDTTLGAKSVRLVVSLMKSGDKRLGWILIMNENGDKQIHKGDYR